MKWKALHAILQNTNSSVCKCGGVLYKPFTHNHHIATQQGIMLLRLLKSVILSLCQTSYQVILFHLQKYRLACVLCVDAISRDLPTWHSGGLFVSFHLNPTQRLEFDIFNQDISILTSSTISQNGCRLESRWLNVQFLTMIHHSLSFVGRNC